MKKRAYIYFFLLEIITVNVRCSIDVNIRFQRDTSIFLIINGDKFFTIKEFLSSKKSQKKIESIAVNNFPLSEALSIKKINSSLEFIRIIATKKNFIALTKDLQLFSSRLANIKRLDIYADSLPENEDFLKKFANLQRLVIVCSGLHVFPEQITNYQYLNYIMIDGCPFEEIPRSISKLKNLEEIWITGSNIKVLPKELGSLKKLKILQLPSNDQLHTIEKGALMSDVLSQISFDGCYYLRILFWNDLQNLKKLRSLFVQGVPAFTKIKITELRASLKDVYFYE